MLDSTLVGDAHLDRPFTIGQVDPSKGYVHVFDDTTLHIVMETLETITDFTQYLTKKERFLTGNRGILAAGEEELLALYLGHLNPSGEHDFFVKGDFDVLHLDEGFWDRFSKSPERQAQIDHDKISYAWDELIEKFATHAMTGTQYFSSGAPLRDQEKAFRWMAREPRTRRRMLANGFLGVVKRSITSGSLWDARVVGSTRASEPYYVFLCLRRPGGASDQEYREKRLGLLSDYCRVVKREHPDATTIIGIATESGDEDRRSEDLVYLNATHWDDEAEQNAIQIQERLGILKRTRMTKGREYEYPVDHAGIPRDTKPQSRNSQCKCGSGKRYRNCHGRKFFPKKGKQKDTQPRT